MSAWFYRSAHAFLRGLHLPPRIGVLGREHLPRTGPAILAANHISHFDPTIIATRFRRPVDYVASSEFFVHPLARAVLRGMNAFPIDRARRDVTVVKECLRRLRAGRLVGIFIEGGIRHGTASVLGGAPFNPAALSLAQMAGAPIVPCVILGSDQLYRWQAWPGRCRIFVGFGAPIAPSADPEPDRAALARELADRMRALAAEMRARWSITDAEMPHSAQERWAGRYPAARPS